MFRLSGPVICRGIISNLLCDNGQPSVQLDIESASVCGSVFAAPSSGAESQSALIVRATKKEARTGDAI